MSESLKSRSDQVNELGAALAKAQGEIASAAKNAQNLHFKNTYADLAAVWDACRGPLSKHGLSVVQTVDHDEAGMTLVTTLLHSSGQWIEGRMHLLLTKQDMQGLGSAITYARRYSLAALVGVAQDDDDAEAATDRTSPQSQRAPVAINRPAPAAAPSFQDATALMCCGGPMLKSKFNPNEMYCPKCKAKVPVGAA